MKKSLLAALLLLAPALAACDTEPGLDFVIEVERLDPAPTEAIPDSVKQIGPGVLEVKGTVTSPCFTDPIRGEGDRDDFLLTVRVYRVPQNPCADDTDAVYRYRGIFGNLRSGNYNVRVVKEMEPGTPVVAVDTVVRVD